MLLDVKQAGGPITRRPRYMFTNTNTAQLADRPTAKKSFPPPANTIIQHQTADRRPTQMNSGELGKGRTVDGSIPDSPNSHADRSSDRDAKVEKLYRCVNTIHRNPQIHDNITNCLAAENSTAE